MPMRWGISPVVTEVTPEGISRYPKISRMADPGRTPKLNRDDLIFVQPTYQHTSIISDGLGRPGEADEWCLSLVFGADLTPLGLDPALVNVIEEDFAGVAAMRVALDLTPRQSAWTMARHDRTRERLIERGARTDGLGLDARLFLWLDALAARVHGRHGGIRALRVTERVA